MRKLSLSAISFFLFILYSTSLIASPILEGERAYPVESSNGMVVTSHYLATDAALRVLRNGGNAIDAAVSAAFVLAVCQPRSGNIGGGGFMLISSEKKKEVIAIDYREKAPFKAHKDMFIGSDGKVNNNLSRRSHLAAGVPGTVAGLSLALEKYGTITLGAALQPAIDIAEKGFIIPPRFSKGVEASARHLKKWEASRKLFFKKNGKPYSPGDLFVQRDLAATHKRIAQNGAREFYQGETAEMLVAEMQKHDGIITKKDLMDYRAIIRQPVSGSYRGYEVYSMSPPSSGGTHIVQILNILENYPLNKWGHNSASTIHQMAEAMKLAYADRAEYLGDTDFVRVPLSGLTSKKYSDKIRQSLSVDTATPSTDISRGNPLPYESNETTHFSIIDRFGNGVSNTFTINFSYGSGIVVEGAGFLLNNEMDDFSALPGSPNAYGLIGSDANKIAPEKRMLSSMSPTIVLKDGKNFLLTGSPGGSRIITTTLQVILNVIDHGMNIQSAVNSSRVHHQWLPDILRIEQGISLDTQNILKQKGHKIVQKKSMGAANSILIKDGVFHGAADPRRSTATAKGF